MLKFETFCGEDLDLGTGVVTKTNPGGGTLPGTQISISTLGIRGAASKAVTATWNPGSLATGGSATTTVSVPGAVEGDFVLWSHDKLSSAGLVVSAYVSAADTVSVTILNASGGPVTIASGTLKVLVLRGA